MRAWRAAFAIAAVTAAAVGVASTAQADENKEHETPISMDQVPAPARATLQREAAGGQIVEVVQETNESGKQVYEARVRKGGELQGIEVDASGKVVKRENEKNEGQ
jgi:hypothetical protein